MPTIDDLYELTDSESKLLFSKVFNDEQIEIREYGQFRWLLINGEAIQSIMDQEKPDQLINPVNISMCLALTFPQKLKKLLSLGLGGAAFERCFQSKLPELQCESLESNEMIIHLAREFFSLPDNYMVYHNQADIFLNNLDEQYDVILTDIFDDERHPDCLYQASFYQTVANNLSDDGVIALNLSPENESDLVKILVPLRQYLTDTLLLEIDEHRNIIVFATKQKLTIDDEMENRVNKLAGQLELDLRDLLKQLVPLPEKL